MGIVYSTAGSILKWLVNGENLGYHLSCYLGLCTNAPDNTGANFQEVPTTSGGNATNYARLPVYVYQQTENKWNLTRIDEGRISNQDYFMFNEATYTWGTIQGFGFFRDTTSTTPFLVGTLSQAVEVQAQRVALFRPDNMIISIDRPSLTSISITPTTSTALVGAPIAWPTDTVITATYNDGTTGTIATSSSGLVTSPEIGSTWTTAGTQSMTITYTEDGISQQTTMSWIISQP